MQNIKKFYKENKNIIDTINQYTTIELLLSDSSNNTSKQIDIEDLLFFYNYIIINKDKLTTIIALLEKIKKLGFEYVKFIIGYDFTKNDYELNLSIPEDLKKIHYFENIKVLNIHSNIDSQKIMTYKTTSSAYTFMFDINGFNRSISTSNEIILNDLTFDANRLPSNISKEEILYTIIKKEKLTKKGIMCYCAMDTNELRNIYHKIALKINEEIDLNKKQKLFAELNFIIVELCKRLNVNYISDENFNEIVMAKKMDF